MYFYCFVPMALSCAAVGFWEINDRLVQKYGRDGWKMAGENISRIAMIILLVVGALCLPKGLKPIRANRAIQKKAGHWLKDRAGKDEFTVLAIKPQEAFYAGAKFQKLTNGSYEDAMQQAKEVNADFIIVDKNIDNICPGFKAMVKEQDLEIFSTEFESSNRRIVIYKLKGSAG